MIFVNFLHDLTFKLNDDLIEEPPEVTGAEDEEEPEEP